jgi:hypothetical protein
LSALKHALEVTLIDNAPHFTVFFNEWHEAYDDVEKSLKCFAFGLSENCRLKVSYRDCFAHAWTAEQKDESGEWWGGEGST